MTTIPQRYRRTDRRTTCLGNTALRVASRGKNEQRCECMSILTYRRPLSCPICYVYGVSAFFVKLSLCCGFECIGCTKLSNCFLSASADCNITGPATDAKCLQGQFITLCYAYLERLNIRPALYMSFKSKPLIYRDNFETLL